MSNKQSTQDHEELTSECQASDHSKVNETPRRAALQTCPTCKQVFTLVENLRRHVRTAHGDEMFPCQTCDKSFARRDALTRHMKLHVVDNATTSGFLCNRCGENFPKSEDLDIHSKTHAVLVDSTSSTSGTFSPNPRFYSALNNSCQRWRSERSEEQDLYTYLHSLDHRQILVDLLREMKAVKFIISVNVKMVRHATYRGSGDTESFPFLTSRSVTLLESSDLDSLITHSYNEILERLQKYIRDGSAWIYAGVEFCDLLVVKYNPLY